MSAPPGAAPIITTMLLVAAARQPARTSSMEPSARTRSSSPMLVEENPVSQLTGSMACTAGQGRRCMWVWVWLFVGE